MLQLHKVSIIGSGSYVPEKVLANADLEKMVDTSDEWITTRTGIKERRIVENGVCTSDLATKAALKALASAKITPEQLDLIILGTATPDNIFPSTACQVHQKISASNAAAFDISAACCSFVYSLTVGYKMVSSGAYKNVLVIAADALTKLTDYTDRATCVLFGDGAGAVLLQPHEQGHELLYSYLGADGTGYEFMVLPAGGSQMPASHETVDQRLHYIKLRGREVFKFAVLKMAGLVNDAAKECNLSLDDIALIIPHQVNLRILEAAAERLNIPMDKIFVNIHKYGNTSSASIAIAFDEAKQSGRLKKDDIVVLVAFGGGLTWGVSVIRW
ncbi:MAG: beta-ketoacyl-ACP synthase III [Planctomycetota bacterium]|nr:beta-ketoacyl-ACP synthase III [Planctomycetota bacterium]MDI6787560.1 beta-ketoacyl-ACP synthase III [Planctomycetota bacterium]